MKQEKLAKIFKALSNKQRLELFMTMYKTCTKGCVTNECCGIKKAFTHACDWLKLSKSTISHHLKELQNAGLINCTRVGQSSYCEVNKEALKDVQNFLK